MFNRLWCIMKIISENMETKTNLYTLSNRYVSHQSKCSVLDQSKLKKLSTKYRAQIVATKRISTNDKQHFFTYTYLIKNILCPGYRK